MATTIDQARKEEIRMGRKAIFIAALAKYLVGDQVRKSIELEMRKESALEWCALCTASPLQGYPTIEEAVKVLTEFLK
jgi:hypothetical protein